jgi:MFS family permease
MSDRLTDAFDFRGRLSFGGRERLSRKLLILAAFPILGPIILLMLGAARALAVAPLILLLPLAVADVAADVRRIHDLNQHAHLIYGRALFNFAMVVGPALAAILASGIPDGLRLAFAALSAAAFLIVTVRHFLRPPIEWRRGDPGPNRFGPPPE